MKLELQDLRKSFGIHRALSGVTFRCESSQSLALIGPSGGGKSTLLRLIAGLLPPDSGSISLNGQSLAHQEPELRRYRQSLGIVFQAYNLFPHLTAIQNIMLPLEKVHRYKPQAAQERALSLLEKFRLADHANKKPAELSGGQRQRVAIARALGASPKLLLFDEPTSALDPEMSAEVLAVIETLKAEGTDFILVTHHMAFARRVADHAVFLSDGTVTESGPAARLFQSPETPALRSFLQTYTLY